MEEQNQPLYESGDKKICYSDFVNTLKLAGIKEGDVVFVHSDISVFGKLLLFDRKLLLRTLTDSIKEVIGENGTIIMPTFTYSFDKNEAYDIENTKSTVGTLTEFFRKQESVSRTIHPSHSVVVWGKYKKELMGISKDTFGQGSVFEKFHKLNGKLVFFGTPFHEACTFIHYIEQMYEVPYRYMRQYKGKIIKDGKEYEDEFSFYYKYSFFYTDMLNLEKHLKENGLLKEVKAGDGSISVIESDSLLKEGLKLLDKDIFFFLKNNSIFKIFNFCIYPFLRYATWLVKIMDNIASKFLRRVEN